MRRSLFALKGVFGGLTCFRVQLLITRKALVGFVSYDQIFFSPSCSVLVVLAKYPVLKVVSRQAH